MSQRVALSGPIGVTPAADIAWSQRSGRYQALAPEHADLLRAVAAADGTSWIELGSSYSRKTLDDLVGAGLIVVWDEQDGLPVPARLIAAAALANVGARLLLRVAPRLVLARCVTLDAAVERPLFRWHGLRTEQLMAAARLAGALPLTDGSCLPTALALRWLLRRDGRRAAVRLAALRLPFAAHAWVEVDGELLDPAPTAFPGDALTALR